MRLGERLGATVLSKFSAFASSGLGSSANFNNWQLNSFDLVANATAQQKSIKII